MSALSVQFFLINLNDFLHRLRTRSADGHAFLHACLHGDRIVNIFLEYRADRLELLQSQVIQCLVLVDAEKHQLSDDPVSITERNAVVYKVVRSICGIRKAVLCAGFHHIFAECHRRYHAREE